MTKFDVTGRRIYVSGRFEGLDKSEVSAYVHGFGGDSAFSQSGVDAILSATPDDPKLITKAKGKKIITLADLPAPLEGYVDRMKAAQVAFRTLFASYRKNMAHHLAFGPPADQALIGRVEKAIGFAMPAELRSLMTQFNGLSCIGAELAPGATLPLADSLMPYAALMEHPVWSAAVVGEPVVSIGIPQWEDVFLRAPEARLTGVSSYGPKEKLKIGSLKVGATEFYERLFPFDLFHSFLGAALYADPVAKDLKVIYASDHWASLTDYEPVSLGVYMEALCGMVWHHGNHWPQRIIQPLSKTAKPTYIRSIHDAAYTFLETRAS